MSREPWNTAAGFIGEDMPRKFLDINIQGVSIVKADLNFGLFQFHNKTRMPHGVRVFNCDITLRCS